jgi:hypothetical protein
MNWARLAGVTGAVILGITGAVGGSALSARAPGSDWVTVANNTDVMPGDPAGRTFNSYNQPSVNMNGLVVFRARSRGGQGGQPAHGIYTRDMRLPGSPVVRILDRTTPVPQPNNLDTTFVETPSFPRIDMWSDTIATRGNHQPVWNYVVGTDPQTGEDIETRAGTTGIYSNPFGDLVTGAAKLGVVPDFGFFAVPGLDPVTPFDVFPGAPSVTNASTIVFKGNFTVTGTGMTGVFYRDLVDELINSGPGAGSNPVVMIASTTSTLIPGTGRLFGSTSPPSAANGQVVFSGFDDEDAPTLGGIYLAPLAPAPQLTTLIGIGQRVPGEPANATFNGLGEGGAFDGRHVGFWGAWGTAARTVRLYCPTEGNKDRIAYCNQVLVCAGTGETLGDSNSVCNDVSDPHYGTSCYQEKQVPVHQGIFVHDITTRRTQQLAKSGDGFDEFLFWNYSGKTPCVGAGHSDEDAEDDGEPARWRSSAFVTVSSRRGSGANYSVAFKARRGDLVGGVYVNRVDGIYLGSGPGLGTGIVTVLDTTMGGRTLDPEAPAGSVITELGLEREGLRGSWLAVNASMGVEGGSEEEGMAGIYVTKLP